MSFRYAFPTSGVTAPALLLPLVSAGLAYFGAMAGVTGAFLLLPFQMSVLGYTAPGVSATNFLYNLFAIPATVFQYTRQRRMNWPLAWTITTGSLPGIVTGYFLRITYLSDPARFKPFAGFVLLYLAWRMARSLYSGPGAQGLPSRKAVVETVCFHWNRAEFRFDGRAYSFHPIGMMCVSGAVGTIGGAYGIGGGAIIAPFCISVLRLPVHSVAGAALFGTFTSSLIGIITYQLGLHSGGMATSPDYLLGTLFGIGGLIGGYLGARTQRYVSPKPIKVGLLAVLLYVSFRYISGIFLGH